MKKCLDNEDCDKILSAPKSKRMQRIISIQIDQGCTFEEAQKIVDDTDSLFS